MSTIDSTNAYDYSILSSYLKNAQIDEFVKEKIDPSIVVANIKSRPNRIPEQIQALDLLPANWQLTPVSPAKKPYFPSWQSQGTEREKIKVALRSQQAWGVGLLTGELSGGIMAIDCDGESAHLRLVEILGQAIPLTVSFSSGRPGRFQLLFQVEEQDWAKLKKRKVENTGNKEQLEFRWNGHQSVLPPSFHPITGCYHWINSPYDVAIAPLPMQVFDYLTAPPEPKKTTPSPHKRTADNSCISPIPLVQCLSKKSSENLNGVSEPGRDNTGIALAFDLVGTANYLDEISQPYEGEPSQIFRDFCQRCNPPLLDDDFKRIYNSAVSSNPNPSTPKEKITKRIDYWRKQSGKQTRTSNLSQINTASTQSGLSIADYELLAQQLGFKLILNHKNEIQSSLVRLTLDLFNLVGNTLKLNLMSREYELAGEQVDINNAQSFVAQKLGYDATTEKCILAIHAIANKQAYHPVSDYLACLKTKPELVDFDVLENMATLFLGNSDPLANKMMAKKLIASVARVMRPGYKDDTLLVLQGNQGARKSTFLSALADPDWFCDDIRDLDNKDELAKLSRHWILELAEVDYLMGRKEVESFKRFLSTTTDTYRPPYGRANIRIARSCSFFATTNKSEFLADPTGDRRYWVIEVMQKIDCELVATYRDMIWASALAAYERGDNWWLSDEEDVSRDSSHSKYRESDAWVDVILGGENELPTTTHGTGEYIKVNQIFDRLCLTPIQRDRKASNRVVKVLLELGFESRVLRIETKNQKVWYREKPLPSLKPLPILKKMSSGYDPVVVPLLLTLPMLPSFKDDRRKKTNEELQENRTEKEEKEEMDLFAISGKIGSVGSVGDNGSTTGVQPLPISKKIGSGEKIGSGLKSKDMGNKELERLPSNDSKCYPEVLVSVPIALLRGDRVKNKKTGEEGIIDLWADNRRKATIKLDNGDLSDWLITSDLELLQRG